MLAKNKLPPPGDEGLCRSTERAAPDRRPRTTWCDHATQTRLSIFRRRAAEMASSFRTFIEAPTNSLVAFVLAADSGFGNFGVIP